MSESLNVQIDLTKFKPKFGDKIPEGTYLVAVTDAVSGETKKGDPKITLWYDVVEGPDAGSTLVDTLTLTENAIFRAVAFMRAIGLPTPKKKLAINLGTWVGKRLEVKVADGQPWGDDNEIRSEVRSYARAQSRTPAASVVTEDPWGETGDLDETLSEPLAEFAEETTSNPEFGTPDSVPVTHGAPATVQDQPLDLEEVDREMSDGDHGTRASAIAAVQARHAEADSNQKAIEDAQDFGTSETINLDDIEGL